MNNPLLENVNIKSIVPLPTPAELRAQVPQTAASARTVGAGRAAIERILDRDDRWLNPEAVAEQVKTRMISDRLDRADAEKKEKEGGFFSRHKTRTTLPPADTSLAPKK